MAKRQREQGSPAPLREPMLRGDLSAWFGWWPERLPTDDILGAWKAALARRGQPGSPTTVQLYTHIAFCRSSCRFCMYFHLVPQDDEQMRRYTDYLVALLGQYRAALGRVLVSNAYFGGGTPSVLPAQELGRFLDAFGDTFQVKSEFTCEGHPSNLDEEKLRLLRRVGVNRLSMGLQSFDAAVLKRIGRTNPSLERVQELVRYARDLGMFTNTDLVLGLPDQAPDSFLADLDCLLTRARPDRITVYRYQPVQQLPDAPAEQMRYSRILTPAVLGRALRVGYLPETLGGDDRFGKNFLRNSARIWRQVMQRVRYEALRLVRADVELPTYALFENADSHILGIGSGARSHIYGHSWYREVTAATDLSATTEAVYVGTRVTPDDECRSALLQAFAKSRWIDTCLLTRRSGVDVQATFGPVLDEAARTGALRRLGRWYAPIRGTTATTHPELFAALLPAAGGDAATSAERAQALRTQPDIQEELVAIAGDHRGGAELSRSQSAGSDEALRAWARLIGLGWPGQRFAAATIESIGGKGEACFRVLPAPAPPLRIIVEPDSGQPSFFRAGPYSISYGTRNGTSLAPAEEQFLQELCTRTRAALALAADVPPAKPALG